MSDLKLEDAVNDFLVQVSTYLLKAEPSCRVYMIQPSGSEFNREFSLHLEEVEQYPHSSIFGGLSHLQAPHAKINFRRTSIFMRR